MTLIVFSGARLSSVRLLASVTALLLVSGGFRAEAQKSQLPTDCIKYLSYYQEDYRAKDYARALPSWRKAFAACPPTASQNLYIHGTTLYTKAISSATDAKLRSHLVDTVLMLQDLRAQYYPAKRRSILNNKGMYIVNYRSDDSAYLYGELLPIVTEIGSEASESVLVNLMRSAVSLYGSRKLTADDVINTYSIVSGAFDGMAPSDEKERARLEKAASAAGALFAESRVASCDDLVRIFSPKLASSPEDAALASSVVRLLGSVDGCQGNELYTRAATILHRREPSARTAYALYRLYAQRDGNDLSEAMKYLEEAVSLSVDSPAERERMTLELAQLAYKEGLRSKAYEAARSVAQGGNGYSGKAYLLLGNLWASAQASGDVDRYARYWVAADYYTKAKSADESLKEEADTQLASVARYFPEASEMFMYDLSAGQGYDISCGGMYAHTTVRTRK